MPLYEVSVTQTRTARFYVDAETLADATEDAEILAEELDDNEYEAETDVDVALTPAPLRGHWVWTGGANGGVIGWDAWLERQKGEM